MTMGFPGTNGVRISDIQQCQEMLDTFFKYGKEIDTARMYCEGTTEQVYCSVAHVIDNDV